MTPNAPVELTASGIAWLRNRDILNFLTCDSNDCT